MSTRDSSSYVLLPLLLSSALIAGCANVPSAAQVCSAEWIKPRTDAALADFKAATGDAWERLESTGREAAETGQLGLAQRARVLLELGSLLNSFQDSQARRDLRRLAKTCDDPNLVGNALITTLEEYQVPQSYVGLLKELDAFIELIGEQRLPN